MTTYEGMPIASLTEPSLKRSSRGDSWYFNSWRNNINGGQTNLGAFTYDNAKVLAGNLQQSYLSGNLVSNICDCIYVVAPGVEEAVGFEWSAYKQGSSPSHYNCRDCLKRNHDEF